MKNFTIATYNVNSIRSRLHLIIPWLAKHRPDVFCMQETKVENDKFPAREFHEAGYHVWYRGKKQYNGVAVASLEEPKLVSFGLEDGESADVDRLIRADFKQVSVVNLYVPQGRERESPHFQYKLRWFSRLRAYLEANYTPASPLVCTGDLNVARESIDVHDPKKLLGHVDFTPEVWEAFDALIAWGLVDVFRKHHHGEAGQFAYFDYRTPKALERGLGWRVDHILATPVMAKRSVDSFIDLEPRRAEKTSDHTIMVAAFKL